MFKKFTTLASLLGLLIILAACGGGGGSPANAPATTATVKITVSGTLPPGTTIAGAGITVTLPPGATVVTDNNGAVAAGVVTPSGVFTSGTQTPPIYTAANGSTVATLKIGLASGTPTGESQLGEIATIVFNLVNGTVLTVASFTLSDLAVVNATTYDAIPGLTGSVAAVTLQ